MHKHGTFSLTPKSILKWRVYVSNNNGPASIGFLILHKDDQRVIDNFQAYAVSLYLMSQGNHYKALIVGLHHALECGITHITARGHDMLLCNQVIIFPLF